MNDPSAGDVPPRDVVPPRGLTREFVLAMNDAVGKPVDITTPGSFAVDVDGLPAGVGPSETHTAPLTVSLSRAELEQVGLTPADVPNINVRVGSTSGKPRRRANFAANVASARRTCSPSRTCSTPTRSGRLTSASAAPPLLLPSAGLASSVTQPTASG